MGDEELKRLEALCEEATPGPWFPHNSYAESFETIDQIRDVRALVVAHIPAAEQHDPGDALFIAGARTALPAALAEVRRLQALVKQAEVNEGTDPACCYWCGAFRGGTEWAERDSDKKKPHRANCPAFTPNGQVK